MLDVIYNDDYHTTVITQADILCEVDYLQLSNCEQQAL